MAKTSAISQLQRSIPLAFPMLNLNSRPKATIKTCRYYRESSHFLAPSAVYYGFSYEYSSSDSTCTNNPQKESTRTLTNAFRKSNVSMVRADSITRRIDPEKVENLHPRKNDLTKFVGILRSNGTFGNSESNH